jgi:hypothetical protein
MARIERLPRLPSVEPTSHFLPVDPDNAHDQTLETPAVMAGVQWPGLRKSGGRLQLAAYGSSPHCNFRSYPFGRTTLVVLHLPRLASRSSRNAFRSSSGQFGSITEIALTASSTV